MKRTLATFCLASSLYGTSAELVNEQQHLLPNRWNAIESETSFSNRQTQQDIAAYEPSYSSNQPLTRESLQPREPQFSPQRKSPFVTVSLASLFPGLGHVYLGEMSTAGELAGSSILGITMSSLATSQESLRTSALSVQAAWSYGLFAAYRDVRKYNGAANYSYRMPTDSFSDLAFAPFKGSILKKPEVWGGFLGALGLSIATAILAFPSDMQIAPINLSLSTNGDWMPMVAFPIGIGEESLFRGYLQSQLAESLNPWAGIALSSLVFGAAHIPNALMFAPQHQWRYYTFSVPFITGMGAYFGWLTNKNHSLKESVAIHVWYDFVLFAASALAHQSASIHRPQSFAMTIPF